MKTTFACTIAAALLGLFVLAGEANAASKVPVTTASITHVAGEPASVPVTTVAYRVWGPYYGPYGAYYRPYRAYYPPVVTPYVYPAVPYGAYYRPGVVYGGPVIYPRRGVYYW